MASRFISEDTISNLKAALGKRDFMSHHRTNVEHNGSQSRFKIDLWSGTQDAAIEQVKYYSTDPNQRVIKEIEYVGWPRHDENLRDIGRGGRILLYVSSLQARAHLVRAIEDERFKRVGKTEPLTAEDNFVAIYFPENWVEEHPDCIDELFERIALIESISPKIIHDLKCFIACNCVARFKKEVDQFPDRIEDADFNRGIKFLRQTHLSGITSPYFAATLMCQEKHAFQKARKLLERIPMSHWQYKDSRDLERTLFVQEFNEKFHKQKMHYEQIIKELKIEIRKLQGNGSLEYGVDLETIYKDFVERNSPDENSQVEFLKSTNDRQLPLEFEPYEDSLKSLIFTKRALSALQEQSDNVQGQEATSHLNSVAFLRSHENRL